MTHERPILFSGPMVRAILEGRKTQTRRVIKPQPMADAQDSDPGDLVFLAGELHKVRESRGRNKAAAGELNAYPHPCFYGRQGDTLWVRETWCPVDKVGWWDCTQPRDAYYEIGGMPRRNGVAYLADSSHGGHEDAESRRCRVELGYRWRPSIHMPRWASRLTLRVTDVRVQRLHEISEADAQAEGIERGNASTFNLMGVHRALFSVLWDSINAKRGHSWDSNPWVWVVAFKRIEGQQ